MLVGGNNYCGTRLCLSLLLSVFLTSPLLAEEKRVPVNWISVPESHLASERAALQKELIDNFSDLEHFGRAIGDKKIVMLDELTHGEADVFQLKSRIVEYLHKHKGFEVLILESGLYDVDSIWNNQRQTLSAQVPGNVAYIYSKTLETQPLFRYLDEQRFGETPLILTGFDGRLSGERSIFELLDSLELYLTERLQKEIDIEVWQSFKREASSLLNNQLDLSDSTVKSNFTKGIDWLRENISALDKQGKGTDVYRAGFWLRVTESLARMAEVKWGDRRFDEHDLVMADNIQWMLEGPYKNKKVIIWGHYIHLNRNGAFKEALNRPNKPVADRYIVDNLTTALLKQYPDDIYVAHFQGTRGSYNDFRDFSEVTVTAFDESFVSAKLFPSIVKSTQTAKAVFVDAQDFPLELNQGLLWEHEYLMRVKLQRVRHHWDGVFFLNKIRPVHYYLE